jgi:uncharacterized glyoxalase superfamily protein PhnB
MPFMEKQYKPVGYNSVSPYFIADGAQKLVDFLKQLFHAVEIRRFDRPDGKIMHTELKIDDSIIMLSDSTENYPAITLIMHVYVPKVDETYQKAISLGCISLEAPQESTGDPDRRATFKDFAGNIWSVGTQV